jgi:hypothetical protein
MGNYVNYKIISEKKLILEYYSGTIIVQDLIKQKFDISREKEYNADYNIIHDLRDAELLISEEEGKTFLNFLKSTTLPNKNRKVAHLTETAGQVTTTTLFTLLNDIPNINIEVFSTLEAAVIWLDLSIDDYYLIYNYFKALKRK